MHHVGEGKYSEVLWEGLCTLSPSMDYKFVSFRFVTIRQYLIIKNHSLLSERFAQCPVYNYQDKPGIPANNAFLGQKVERRDTW